MQVPEQIGRYQIIGMIGKGGMGFVLKGYDATLQRQVAIKVLYPHLAQDENTVARFLTEARTAASLQHPNIIAIYEAGEDKGLYYFAMEFVDGKDLGTIIRERGRLRLEEALPILEQIGMALDYAHQRGIIHRDIKASNIMVTVEGLVKVTDFGIARVLGGERFTQTGVLVGTPEYMAPELWEGKEADKRADIYALGILAYEMLIGRVPFEGDTALTIGYKHVNERPPLPTHFDSSLPNHVNDAILQALDKNPEHRFQTAMAFVNVLKGGYLGSKVPPLSVEVSPLSGITTHAKKIWLPMGLVATVLAFLGLIFIIVAINQGRNPSNSRDTKITSSNLAEPSHSAPFVSKPKIPLSEPKPFKFEDRSSWIVKASSTHNSYYDRSSGTYIHYLPEYAIDGTLVKAWGVHGEGIGEWIKIVFPSVRTITRVGIVPGYTKSHPKYGNLFRLNNRVKGVQLEFSDGSSVQFTFTDDERMQYINLDPPVRSQYVKITIKSIYRGTKWNDTLISEVEVWGYEK
jgi:serine/threonine-protein kinase